MDLNLAQSDYKARPLSTEMKEDSHYQDLPISSKESEFLAELTLYIIGLDWALKYIGQVFPPD